MGYALSMLWGNKKDKKYNWINKLHDIHKNEVDTLSRQNVIHICTPCFLFWPGSVKNEGSIHRPKSLPLIQWKSCHKISKICWHLDKGFFDSTIGFHVQHGLWLYQFGNNRCWWQWGNRRETFTVLQKWSRSVSLPAGRPIVRVAAVNFLSCQTSFL